MQIMALLCDYARVRGATVTLVNGGFSRFNRPALPDRMDCYLACLIGVTPESRDIDHVLRLEIVGPSGNVIGSTDLPFRIESQAIEDPAETLYLPATIDLTTVALTEYGTYRFELFMDGLPLDLNVTAKATGAGIDQLPVAFDPAGNKIVH